MIVTFTQFYKILGIASPPFILPHLILPPSSSHLLSRSFYLWQNCCHYHVQTLSRNLVFILLCTHTQSIFWQIDLIGWDVAAEEMYNEFHFNVICSLHQDAVYAKMFKTLEKKTHPSPASIFIRLNSLLTEIKISRITIWQRRWDTRKNSLKYQSTFWHLLYFEVIEMIMVSGYLSLDCSEQTFSVFTMIYKWNKMSSTLVVVEQPESEVKSSKHYTQRSELFYSWLLSTMEGVWMKREGKEFKCQ